MHWQTQEIMLKVLCRRAAHCLQGHAKDLGLHAFGGAALGIVNQYGK